MSHQHPGVEARADTETTNTGHRQACSNNDGGGRKEIKKGKTNRVPRSVDAHTRGAPGVHVHDDEIWTARARAGIAGVQEFHTEESLG